MAAAGSYLDARWRGGRWLVRIEDVDEARTVPGAADTILTQLEAHGLLWDGAVVYQSQRKPLYEAALVQLGPWIYPCACTRREAGSCRCREQPPAPGAGRSLRIRGEAGIEDFIVRRADGFFAYQLAVVVDDGEQGVTDVVRGADLLDATPRQNLLQRRLGLPQPRYLHLPVALGPDGSKLSKQNGAPPLGVDAVANLRAALAFLGQTVPEADSPAAILAAAVSAWDPARVPAARDFLCRRERSAFGEPNPVT